MKTQFAHAENFESQNSQEAFLQPIARSAAASKTFATSAWPSRIRAAALAIANFALWIAQASIIRSVAPGARAQERHEFESIQARRGGFGNVF